MYRLTERSETAPNRRRNVTARTGRLSRPRLAGMETENTLIEARDDSAEIEDEMLVEEISIDGMCGVY